ncbi:MAG TPA: autotransporter domain-containing protein [Xanthobacteraceae bacterium]|nr:autotransporter domain-containing protein [Xanthobacteraceae bacterium]
MNQGNGTPGSTTGYGDGTQSGLTLGVQSGASVTGSFPGPLGPPFTTAIGISVANGNAITLQSGAAVTGISANGATGIVATNGNTITLQSNAAVTGTSTGISLGSNNTVDNLGTITTAGIGGVGDVFGINASGPLTVNNSGTIGRADVADNIFDLAGINAGGGFSLTNSAGGVILGASGVIGVGTGNVIVNSGLISAIGGGGTGIDFSGDPASTVTVTNNASGTITADAYGINASTATVSNYGTISAPTFGGTGVNANNLTLTNYASGIISGDGGAISGSMTPTLTITNFGTISGGIDAASGAISGNVVNVTNSGTISVASGSGGSAISMASGSVTNNAGGSITGDFDTIASEGNTTIFNAGTISAASGDAILFAFFGGNTLTIAPTSVINGNVVATGTDTFQLGGTGTGTFDLSTIGPAQQYEGFDTFNVIGATWTAINTFAQNSPWTVQGGTFLVNGDLSSASSLTVTGGTLGGIGTVGDTQIDGGGTLAPGSGSPSGTLTVSGNLAFNTGSFYAIQIAPGAGNNSKTVVNGTATLGGNGTVVVTPQVGNYNSTVYQILTTPAPVDLIGTFAGLTVNGNVNGTATLNYVMDPGDVDLVISGSILFTPPSGANQNQQNVLNGLNDAILAGDVIPPNFQNLATLPGPVLLNDLTQLSGEDATGAQKSAFQLMQDFLNLLTDPSSDGQGGGAAGQVSQFAPEQDASLPPDIALAYAHALHKKPPPSSQPQPQDFEQRWSGWASGFGGSGRYDGNAAVGSTNVTANDYGYAAGMTYHVTPGTDYGFALAGGGTNWNLAQSLGGGRSDAFQAGVYGTTHFGPAYLSGALAFANHWFSTNRIAVGDNLTAKFEGQSYAARGEAGYRFGLPVTGTIIGVTPYAAVQVQDFHTPGYSETDLSGGGFGLSYASVNATDTRSELGARFDNLTVWDGTPLVLRGRLAWAHDWVSNPALGAVFQALPGSNFTVNGAAPPKNAALTTAGAELHLTANWTAMAKFDGEFGSGAQTYAGTGTIRYSW